MQPWGARSWFDRLGTSGSKRWGAAGSCVDRLGTSGPRARAARRRLAGAIALGMALGGCFTGPAPASSGPTMRLSPTSLVFASPAGGADPAPQTITVDDADGGALAPPTTQITYRSVGGWLSATVSGTAAPYAIAVQATIARLPPGSYDATMEVDSPGASSSPQSVSVVLAVGSGSQPTISLSPATLAFTSTAGATPPAQDVTVSNIGTGTLALPVTSITYLGAEKGWLTATVAGTTAPYTITVQPNIAGIPPRPSPEFASIAVDCPGASNTPLTIPVQLTVR